MSRCIVNVADTPHYRIGQQRLIAAAEKHGAGATVLTWDHIPRDWPTHQQKMYAFKAFALKFAAQSFDTLLWCDAAILPIRSLEPLWQRIERDGYFVARNGWTNAEWCCDEWYRDCFPGVDLNEARAANAKVQHVVATCFGLSMKHDVGREILSEYFRLAGETRAFCGPWMNANHPDYKDRPIDGMRCASCGPPNVHGARHDQSCLSIICDRLGVALTDPPNVFCYKGSEDERTILLAAGDYT